MSEIRVDTAARTLSFEDLVFPCVIGRGGARPAADKREGDGATPLGRFAVRTLLLRPGRLALAPALLPWRWLREGDGWSDDPRDPAYNRPVTLPHAFGAERLWRDDHAYDAILVLGHNDAPPVPGLGSAIFLHLAQPDRRPTEGCVALDREDLLLLVPRLAATTAMLVA